MDNVSFNLRNPLCNVDSYKISHYNQFPPGTEYVSCYIESRGGRWSRTLFYGLQIFLKEYLSKPFTLQDLDEAEDFWTSHGEPFNREAFEYVLKEYNGFWPVRIQAAPEGLVIPTGNVLVQIVNTDPKCFWVPGFLETALLRAVWYPTAVATNSYMCKQIIKEYLDKTSDNPEVEINFALHDFGARGVSSFESCGIGSSAHLVNFMGTDSATGALFAKKYYNAAGPVGYSIPASEHSTITSWGNEESEIRAFENMIDQFGGPGKIYACVSDSYDLWAAVDKWYSLKDKIIKKGGILVIRPDSGNPVAVVSGLIDALMNKFGYSINNKGYKVLPDYIRVIQGDGVDEKSIKDILQELSFRKISTSNVVFGIGGCLLQHLDRDTLKFAMKCSAIRINGEWNDVFKDPITDSGKRSKKGRLALVNNILNKYETKRVEELEYDQFEPNILECVDNDILRDIWMNGKLLIDEQFEDIRARVK